MTTIHYLYAAVFLSQVLVVSLLFGIALLSQGDRANMLVSAIEQLSHTLFVIVGIIMRLAPIGAFGAMAFTVGRYGVGSLLLLGKLMAGVYVTCVLFVLVVLGLAHVVLFVALLVMGSRPAVSPGIRADARLGASDARQTARG